MHFFSVGCFIDGHTMIRREQSSSDSSPLETSCTVLQRRSNSDSVVRRIASGKYIPMVVNHEQLYVRKIGETLQQIMAYHLKRSIPLFDPCAK